MRTTNDLHEGDSLFYRIEDKTALSEMKLTVSREGEFIPSRFILETRRIYFGSFNTAGMWKFIEMESLLSPSALKDTPGLKPDRSSQNSLKNPAAAYILPERAGILCRGSEEYIHSAIWGILYPGNYSSVNTGLSMVLPDPNPEDYDEDGWFIDKDTELYTPLYHSLVELNIERAKTSYSLLTAVSGATTLIPGCSILPEFTFYGNFWDWNSRFWYNSPNWLNSKIEPADTQYYLENSFDIKMNNGFKTLLKWHCYSEDTPDFLLVHGFQSISEMEFASLFCLAEYKLIPSDMSLEEGDTEFPYHHYYRSGIGWTAEVWRSRAEASIKHDRYGILEWTGITEIKRAPRKGRYSLLKCVFKSVPGLMSMTAGMEESFYLKNIHFKLAGAYPFNLLQENSYDADSLSLSLTAEWKID